MDESDDRIEPLEITTRVDGEVAIIDLSGNICLCGQTGVPRAVMTLLQQGFLKFLINFHGIPYIDSSGLAGVARAYVMVSRQGGALRFINVAPRIRELFVVTRLANVFDVFDDEADALRSLKAPLAAAGDGR